MKLTDSFLSLVKGGIIGISSLIPCLSSGSVIYSLSIYENFIDGISNILKENNRKLYLIVIPTLIGIICGLLGGINVVEYSMNKYQSQTLFLFIGLLVGGLKLNYKNSNIKFNFKKTLLFLIITCFLVAIYLLLTNYINFSLPKNCFFKFILGLFIGITIIIPGLPISSFLSSFDKYNYLSSMVSSLSISNLISLLLFIFGIILGVLIIANILSKFHKKYSKTLSLILLSFLFSSIIILLLNLNKFSFTFNCVFTSLLAFLWGYILAINLEKENDR